MIACKLLGLCCQVVCWNVYLITVVYVVMFRRLGDVAAVVVQLFVAAVGVVSLQQCCALCVSDGRMCAFGSLCG